jgi:hypothetical protein
MQNVKTYKPDNKEQQHMQVTYFTTWITELFEAEWPVSYDKCDAIF